jgi:hypothetical protein
MLKRIRESSQFNLAFRVPNPASIQSLIGNGFSVKRGAYRFLGRVSWFVTRNLIRIRGRTYNRSGNPFWFCYGTVVRGLIRVFLIVMTGYLVKDP